LNQTNEIGFTALHLACIYGCPTIVKLLVADKRVDIMKEDKQGRTALFYAALNGTFRLSFITN